MEFYEVDDEYLAALERSLLLKSAWRPSGRGNVFDKA